MATMADLSANLCSRTDKFHKAKKEYKSLVTKGKASEQKKNYSRELRNRAREELDSTVKTIKALSSLTLYTIEEVKAFVGLLSLHFEDRGALKKIKLGTDRDEMKRKMWAALEIAGMKLDQKGLNFSF